MPCFYTLYGIYPVGLFLYHFTDYHDNAHWFIVGTIFLFSTLWIIDIIMQLMTFDKVDLANQKKR
jgi:hypothetical protein